MAGPARTVRPSITGGATSTVIPALWQASALATSQSRLAGSRIWLYESDERDVRGEELIAYMRRWVCVGGQWAPIAVAEQRDVRPDWIEKVAPRK
jgi:hypothetical protein